MKKEEMMEEKAVEICREQMEGITGGKNKDDDGGHHNTLNGPFCINCKTVLTFANGSYKCMKAGCILQGKPQAGFYN
jgi:hypothetical protein